MLVGWSSKEAGRKFNETVRAFGRKVSSRCLWITTCCHVEQRTRIPLSRECREWWMMMNKCCDVVLFVKLCVSPSLSIPNYPRNSLSRFAWKWHLLFPKCCPDVILLMSFVVEKSLSPFHFGYLLCFSSRGNLHWLMLWYAHKIIESSTCSTTCFALCSDTRRKCVCMYVELCSFRVLKIFFNYIVSVLVNQPPCPISFHCHQQTFFTFSFQCFISDEKKTSSPSTFIWLFPSMIIDYKLRFVFEINLQNSIKLKVLNKTKKG